MSDSLVGVWYILDVNNTTVELIIIDSPALDLLVSVENEYSKSALKIAECDGWISSYFA